MQVHVKRKFTQKRSKVLPKNLASLLLVIYFFFGFYYLALIQKKKKKKNVSIKGNILFVLVSVTFTLLLPPFVCSDSQ